MNQNSDKGAFRVTPYTTFGGLTINVFTAGGAVPLEGAVVRISDSEKTNSDFEVFCVSGANGHTDNLSLPAPSSRKKKKQPYAEYDIDVELQGFFRHKCLKVPVFEGVNAVQPVEMIPLKIPDD